jgi:uncharacterized protein (TIGR03382 family)
MRPLALAAAVVALASSASARPEYVGGAPNVECASCHVNPAGGGARNAFGQDVEAAMPFTGPDTNTWTALFCVDSDGDGRTNGEELGDACGVWRIGDSNPDFTATSPGDDTDTTATAGECDGGAATTCELDEEAGGGCSATASSSSSSSLAAVALLALLGLRRRRR